MMHEHSEQPDASLQAFEARLRELQPMGLEASSESESELLYRCGWEAANAESSRQLTAHRRDWKSFLAGAGTGLAAAWLGILCLPFFSSASTANQTEQLVNSSSVEERPIESQPDPRKEIDVQLLASELAAIDAGRLLTQIFPWAMHQRLPEMPAEETPAEEMEEYFADTLSPAARRNWQDVLSDKATQASLPVIHSPRRFKSLGEILRDYSRSNDIL